MQYNTSLRSPSWPWAYYETSDAHLPKGTELMTDKSSDKVAK